MEKSCTDTLISYYTRNRNIKIKLKNTTGKSVTIASPDDLFKHGNDIDHNR